MAKVQHMLHVEIDLEKPVIEICEVIAQVLKSWQGKESEILDALQLEIASHQKRLKGAEASGQ